MKNKDETAACIAVSLFIGSLSMLAVATAFFALFLYTSWKRTEP